MVRDSGATFHVARQWYGKGVAHRRLKRYKDALVCFDRALALCDTDGDWWNWKGVTLSDLQRHEEALACFDRTLALSPDDAYAADFRAFCLFKLDRDEEALVAYDYALTLDPTAGNSWYWKGRTLFWLQRDDEALVCFDRAVELAPDKVNYWYWKGSALRRLKRDEEALACFERALELAPNDAPAARERAAALYRLQRDEEALVAYAAALSIAPEDDPDELNYWRGRTLHRLKRDEEALVAYDRALAINPNQSGWWAERSLACETLHRYDESLANAEQAITLDESNGFGWKLKGFALFELGRYEEALAADEQTLQRLPTDGQALCYKGSSLYCLGRFEEAATSYDEAFRLNPDDADLRRQYSAALANIRRATPDHRLKLRDGRWLGYLDFGDPDGAPVILCHGTPGSRLDFLYDEEMLKDLHIRAIVPDRPGYGLSDFQRHRRLLDWPADVEQLADHLGLERFAVLGVSGGGPHAAACAYAIPHRLTRVGLVSSAAPLELAPLRTRLPIERLANFTARYFPWPVLLCYQSLEAPVGPRQSQSFGAYLLYPGICSAWPIIQIAACADQFIWPDCPVAAGCLRNGSGAISPGRARLCVGCPCLRPSLGISPGRDPWRRGLSLAWRARRSRLDCGGARAGDRHSRLSGDVLSERDTCYQ